MTLTQREKLNSKANDISLSGRVAIQDMLGRVMNVAQLLHNHEQSLGFRGADLEKAAEKSQSIDAIVS